MRPESRVKIMGILNVTPDSFSDGGEFTTTEKATEQAIKMIADGADVIDIGGESTRPGAAPVSAEEEKKRIVPVLHKLRQVSQCPVSIDTTKALVAGAAIDFGATMVNDISAGRFDSEMLPLVARSKVQICLMHMQGTPRTMQENPRYKNVVGEVKEFLQSRIEACLKAGIEKEKIVVDPGIGFGKNVEDNLALLRNLDQLQELECSVLIGTSRKSFIGALTGATVENRLPGSLAGIAVAVQKGASIVRVHDVAETKQFLSIIKAVF